MKQDIMLIKQNINKEQQLSKKEELKMWMQKIELVQYDDIFIKNGFEDLLIVKLLNMDTLNHMKIKKIGHKMKLLSEIEKLKQFQNNVKSHAQEGNIMIDTLQNE